MSKGSSVTALGKKGGEGLRLTHRRSNVVVSPPSARHTASHKAALLWTAAESLFFADRTFEHIVERADIGKALPLIDLLYEHRIDLKRIDALALVDRMTQAHETPAVTWRMETTSIWRQVTEGIVSRERSSSGPLAEGMLHGST